MGVENMLKHYIPEIQTVEAQDGFSDVDPFYSDPYAMSFYDRMEGPDGEFDN
jgi:hypothetical protein